MAPRSRNVLPYRAKSVEKAGLKASRRTEWRIEGVHGLVLDVTPHGTATYRFVYHARSGKARKLRKMKIGRRDAITLQQARNKADQLRAIVEAGGDPVREQAAREKAQTFEELAEQRLKHDPNIAESTRDTYRTILSADVYPEIGDIPASEVTPQMVRGILDKIEAREAARQADHVKSAIGSTYKWARKRHGLDHDPTVGLGKRAPSQPRTRVLTDDELKALWTAITSDDAPLSPPMRIIFQLAVLTGQRRSEVAGARRSELSLDVDKQLWTIPGDDKKRGKVVRGRTKNGKEQIIPLSKQAAGLFRQALELSDSSEFVFPANMKSVKVGKTPRTLHINGQSLSRAMGRLRERYGIENVNLHDMRRCIATWLGENGERPDVIDRILNHQPRDVTRRHYNHSLMEPQVRRALQLWADHIDELVTGLARRGTENVVPLRVG